MAGCDFSCWKRGKNDFGLCCVMNGSQQQTTRISRWPAINFTIFSGSWLHISAGKVDYSTINFSWFAQKKRFAFFFPRENVSLSSPKHTC